MDFATIFPAVLSAGVTLIVCLINGHFQSSRTEALISYRLEQLENKVDKHNNLIERTFQLEKLTAQQSDELHRHNERMRDMESKIEKMEDDHR